MVPVPKQGFSVSPEKGKIYLMSEIQLNRKIEGNIFFPNLQIWIFKNYYIFVGEGLEHYSNLFCP